MAAPAIQIGILEAEPAQNEEEQKQTHVGQTDFNVHVINSEAYNKASQNFPDYDQRLKNSAVLQEEDSVAERNRLFQEDT